MRLSVQRETLMWSALAVVAVVLGYFLWQQLKLENQLHDLKMFCGGLKDQATLEEIRIATTFSPSLTLTLMEPNSEGNQIGLISILGVPRGGCSLTLMRGRLTQKSFSFGSVSDPSKPGEKLAPW